ncbi:Pex15p KNAG_0L00530 [Huiozyma naganishii CBS 8797]|uniref:Uncharacterized protein n=1 Tax=Huiozyma naganishii (strain ATCC MYA-139 / BCRC 22969 / CBS 8797 / KCTC 17520 / NBRC 10181 / NCYC 3082 / Yp74L-3) TaxID=1071383 RepID=J7SB24_HUIN7|nr:hypothetical protein KNAG_0L00530 [Kazachstania naganishii CBS 8797]CCK72676.1 hypothetical protein KNAG_0L00530 [Kazachstania naganishii CBS 8797]
MSLSVDDILEDDTLGSTILLDAPSAVDSNYRECMNLLVKGQPKGALERMFERGVLNDEALDSPAHFTLCLSCYSNIPDFASLGVSLQTVAKRVFDVQQMNDTILHLRSRDDAMAQLEKYFVCFVRTLHLQNSRDRLEGTIQLQSRMKDEIRECSEAILNEEDALVLRDMVYTYLVDLEVGLLHNKKSLSLYDSLCLGLPQLRDVLQRYDTMGTTFEDTITRDLGPLPKPKKTAAQRPISAVTPKPITNRDELQGAITGSEPEREKQVSVSWGNLVPTAKKYYSDHVAQFLARQDPRILRALSICLLLLVIIHRDKFRSHNFRQLFQRTLRNSLQQLWYITKTLTSV